MPSSQKPDYSKRVSLGEYLLRGGEKAIIGKHFRNTIYDPANPVYLVLNTRTLGAGSDMRTHLAEGTAFPKNDIFSHSLVHHLSDFEATEEEVRNAKSPESIIASMDRFRCS